MESDVSPLVIHGSYGPELWIIILYEMNKPHFLSLIIPVYKQEKSIVSNISTIKSTLNSIRYEYEIIVVVDGLVDNSLNLLFGAAIPKVRIISYSVNQGKSFAIRLGMHYAHGDYIMFMDSGNEIDPNGISMLLEHMEWYDADIIVGSKRHPASYVNYSFIRKILSWGYYLFVKLLFGIKIHDTQAGIKVFKRKTIESVLPRLIEKKFAGDLEILVVANLMGFRRIYEAPIRLDYNLAPITSAGTLKSVWGIFLDTLAIYFRTYISRYYDKVHQIIKQPNDIKLYFFES